MNKLVVTVAALSAFLGGCASRQDRAQEAFEAYQAAAADGDLQQARRALLELVAAEDSVADYWIELGKVQLQLSDFGGAYNSFSRAHELDRANVAVLSVLTNLALRSGHILLAEKSARELELIAPDDPAVALTYGYVALRRGKLDEADQQASKLLAASPHDASAKVLRSLILLQSGNSEEAIALLREQVRLQPSDEASLRTLVTMYQLREQWPDAAWAARKLLEWRPKDQEIRAQLIESELRSGRAQVAALDTVAGLAEASALEIGKLLAPWVNLQAEQQVADAVFKLARTAHGDRQIALARFLALAGRPQQVLDLTRSAAKLPVTARNASANALYGAALALTGDAPAGLDRLNRVIALDSANVDAMRARAELRSRQGNYALAIEDAQKLIAANRQSPAARLLLAKIHLAAGNVNLARRTLWDAFHDIPADRSIYGALRVVLAKSEGKQSIERLAQEFNDQRTEKITRGFA